MSRKSIHAVLPALAFGVGVLLNAGASAATVSAGALLGASCAACHNTNGRSVEGTPVIAGIDRDQFVATLKEFQSGARKATVMHRHAKGYTDAEIALLADYFSAQKR